jgi:hypothetical protein
VLRGLRRCIIAYGGVCPRRDGFLPLSILMFLFLLSAVEQYEAMANAPMSSLTP